MTMNFEKFNDPLLSEAFIEWLIEEQYPVISAHFSRLWEYYQNPLTDIRGVHGAGAKFNASSRPYVQAQEQGLPARITGVMPHSGVVQSVGEASQIQRKEIVIENDITWRVNAMVDFLFGRGVALVSRASDVQRRREIEAILNAVFANNGASGFFQDMAVLGGVYGFVDCLLRPDAELFDTALFSSSAALTPQSPAPSNAHPDFTEVLRLAGKIGLELIEAPRALPVLEEHDYRRIRTYIQHFYQDRNSLEEESFWSRFAGPGRGAAKRRRAVITEIIGPCHWQRYENGELLDEGPNPLGVVPVVHIQNIAQPYTYEGQSDVEQLIPLQDELNTRLSDRANRLTLQSFKMYLVKGLHGIDDQPVSPGRMWATDNTEAAIEQFGGDSAAPSEESHISEIRDAMDKVNGVLPIVAGLLRDKVGNLTSAVAIRMVFMGMLAKNTRKQFTYGQGIRRIASLVLHTLDTLGIYSTSPAEREIETVFPDALPEDTLEKLKESQIKRDLGVPQNLLLRELGYEV